MEYIYSTRTYQAIRHTLRTLDRSAGRSTHLAEGERQVCLRRVAVSMPFWAPQVFNHTEELSFAALSGVYTECRERKFLSVVVNMRGPKAVLFHNMTPLAGTPLARLFRRALHLTPVQAQTQCPMTRQQPQSSARLAPLAQATCGLGRPCERATADSFSTICNAYMYT